MRQEAMFGMEAILAERDAAITRVSEHADRDWKATAYAAAVGLAQARHTFVSEDVWEALRDSDVATHEPRAMGPIMRALHRDGIVEPTTTFITSPSPLGHGRPSRVWRSLITGGTRA